MHIEPHFMLGWAIGNVGGGDRALRTYCAIGAILPDLDALPIVLGAEAYGRYHHTFGHNVFLWAAFVAWVTWRQRSQRAFWLSIAAFGSHLLADAWLSGWYLMPFWPAFRWDFLPPGGASLEAPINLWLVYLSLIAIPVLGIIYKRTPLEIISPKFDQFLASLFEKKRLDCGFCGWKANHRCSTCGKPVCPRHGRVGRNLLLSCPDCSAMSGRTTSH